MSEEQRGAKEHILYLLLETANHYRETIAETPTEEKEWDKEIQKLLGRMKRL